MYEAPEVTATSRFSPIPYAVFTIFPKAEEWWQANVEIHNIMKLFRRSHKHKISYLQPKETHYDYYDRFGENE